MEAINFSAVDLFILGVAALSLIIGWIRGATKEILSVVAWVGGIYLAISSFPYAQSFTRSYIKHGLIADFVTACGLFILFLTILSVLNYYCSNFVKKSALNVTDKALGGVFGIGRAVVILAVADLVVNQCVFTDTPKWLEDSKLRPIVGNVSNFMVLIMPKELQDKLLSHMSQMKKESLLGFIKNDLIENISPDSVNDMIEEGFDDKIVAKVTAVDGGNASAKEDLDNEFIEDVDVDKNEQSAKELATLKPKKSVASERKQNKSPTRNQKNEMGRILDQYDDVNE
ncbi:MAG: CvpA family protein [Holosporales bacterium]|jgi:membrane protein required for colicin V production|nr:CvpA family protein [Holosporales bacterium]